MASTGEFSIASSPTMTGNMTATCRRDGGTVIVDWSAAVRLTYSGSLFGTGNTMQINASGSAGGSSSAMIHNSNDSWRDTSWHYCSGSFSYANASAHSFTVTFSSTTNTSNAGKFSGKTVSLSIGAFDANKTIFIGCNGGAYMEFMCKTPYTFPTWSDANGQDDIVWVGVGSGSWDRGGIHYEYAAGHTHTNAFLDDAWNTHVYIGTTGYGGFYYYPRIYVKYNANGGKTTPSQQTKYLGSTLTLASGIARDHYTFNGWSDSASNSSGSAGGTVIAEEAWNSIGGAMSSNNGWTNYIPAHNGNTVTLYATWKGNTYTVSYNANGGSSTPTKDSAVYPNSLTLNGAISRNNKTADSNVTITVSYNTNGGSTAPTASTGTAVNTTTTKYTFEKWHLNSATGTAYSAGASYKPTSNVTMYAGWTSNSSTTRKTNPSITLTTTKPTRNGYIFLGWSTSSTATTATYMSGTAYTFSESKTLYAVWKEDQAYIRIRTNGSWKRGKGYYKRNNVWEKIKKIYVKKDGQWKVGTNK